MKELVALLLHHGVLLVFMVTLAARVGAPFPAAPLLVVAGGLAMVGQISGWAAFAASLLANVLGDAAWFWGGRHFGPRVMRSLCRISLSPDSCVKQSETLILRWGGTSLIAAKFVPGVSVVAAPMAGALAMSWRRFLAFELVAGALWTGVFLGLGVLFGNQVERVLDTLAGAGVAAVGGVLFAVVLVIAVRWWRRRRYLHQLDMPRISVAELQALLLKELQPVVVDVRSKASRELDSRHIPGALHIHLPEIRQQADTLPRDREIVLYCDCPNDVSAALAARQLRGHGHTRVRPLAGGLSAWVSSGAPLATLPPADRSPVASSSADAAALA